VLPLQAAQVGAGNIMEMVLGALAIDLRLHSQVVLGGAVYPSAQAGLMPQLPCAGQACTPTEQCSASSAVLRRQLQSSRAE
jgi:hypothetical protein